MKRVAFIFSGFFFLPIFVLAYSDNTTHPALTQEIVKLFNQSFPDRAIDNADSELIIQGSIDEDSGIRWMQHFYDPVYKRGLVLGKEWMSLKEWSQNTMAQAGISHRALAGTLKSYFGGEDDYSWDRAIYEYAWGDKQRGLRTLGHILHLLEDATVPDHTRNDPHPPILDMGSPYEGWTKKFDRASIRISELDQLKPTTLTSVNDYFETLANYSNRNFFSKDTIKSSEYREPTVAYFKNEQLSNGISYRFAYSKENHKLFRTDKALDWRNLTTDKEANTYLQDNDNLILTDYWNLLSKQAVAYGAGAIKLFFDEVAKEKGTKVLYEKNRSWLMKKLDVFTARVFRTADVLYGISVEPEDVAGANEGAQIVSAVQSEESPASEPDSSQEAPSARSDPLKKATLPLPLPHIPPPEPAAPEIVKLDQSGKQNISTFQKPVAEPQKLEPLKPIKKFVPSNTSFFVPIAGGGASPPKNNAAAQESAQESGAKIVIQTQSSEEQSHSESATSTQTQTEEQSQPAPDAAPPDPPIITSPSQWHASTTQVLFSGTAEANSTISTNFSGATTTAGSAWSLLLTSLPQGTTTIQFFAKDTAGNVSSSTEKSIFIDTTAPDATLIIEECKSSLASNSCLIATTTLRVQWFAAEIEDFDHYEIACEIGGTPCPNFSLFQTTATSTIYQTSGADAIYTFKVKAVDSFGNKGTEAEKSFEIITRPVVINEIAWAGTSAARSADEYIELYNPTTKSISLSGIALVSLTDAGGPNISLSGTLAPRAYYLIERTDDTTVSDIIASTTASFGNGLSNNGEALALILTDGTILDRTPALNSCGGWCAGVGIGGQYFSMERYDPTASGEDKENWASGAGPFSNGKNADGNSISGSPGRRNTANYLVSTRGTFLEKSKTLTKDYSPYVIGPTFGIGQDKTLTIEPGVVIKMRPGASLAVNGALKAEGTAENPIVFTSIKDDSFGGDTNQDGDAETPRAGDWGSIILRNDESIITHAIVRYGGNHDAFASTWGNIRAEYASPAITHSIIEHSATYGVWFKHASSTFEENIVRNNNANASIDSTGMVVENGKVRIAKNTFDDNYYGLRIIASEGNTTHEITVSENIFTNNKQFAAQISGAYALFSGNASSGNGINGINLQGSPAREEYLLSSNIPYVISSTGLFIPQGKTLKAPPGTIVKLSGNGGISINGTLDAQGTSGQKIVFTSLNDDEYGGDTNGTSTRANAGDWNNLALIGSGASSSTLEHVVIRYGGAKSAFSPHGAFRIDTSSPTIKNATIEKNYRVGVWMKNAAPSISDSTIQDHQEPAFPEQSYGMFLTETSSPTLASILFKNNRTALWSGGAAQVVNGGGIIFEGNAATTTNIQL